MPPHNNIVRNYYDQNTRLFLALRRSQKAENIRRSLWTDGVQTLEEALHVTDERIRAEIEAVTPVHARIADLGCGVGAGLMYITQCLNEPEFALGITLSSVQAQLAGQFCRQAGLENKIIFTEGDFTAMPLMDRSLDAAFSVEAFVHSPEPERFFQEASRLLRPGGKLIVVDDFQAEHMLSVSETEWLHTFMAGWHVPGVRTVKQICEFGEMHQLRLQTNENITRYLRLRNLPDLIARSLRFVGNRLHIAHSMLPSMLGSMALQQCLYQGIIEYRFLVFERL
jgi:tocopherol O-methyltransferase